MRRANLLLGIALVAAASLAPPRSAIALMLLLLPASAWAAPTITNVNGTPTHGTPMIITGSGFGTHPLDIEWTGDWIEAQTDGTNPNTKVGWEHTYPDQGVTDHISSLRSWSGSKSMDLTVDQANPESNGSWASTLSYLRAPFDKIYATFWIYSEPVAHFQGTSPSTLTQLKFLTITCDNCSNDRPLAAVTNSTMMLMRMNKLTLTSWQDSYWENNTFVDCSGLPYPPFTYAWELANGVGYTKNQQSYWWPEINRGESNLTNTNLYAIDIGGWTRVELYADRGTPDVADGEVFYATQKVDSPRRIGTHYTDVRHATNRVDCRSEAAAWQRFVFYLLWDDPSATGASSVDKAFFNVDDVYIQFGTRARVEIGNEPVYANCTQLEVQVPTAWADGSITANVNLGGSFAGDPTLYAFVIDDAGVASAGVLLEEGSSVLLHSTMDSAAAIHTPTVSQANYATQGEAIPGSANVTYVAGPSGNAAKVTAPSASIGDILFRGDNFDFFDTAQDGGRVDLIARFDTDPKARPNDWLLYSDPIGDGRWINFEMTGTPSRPVFFGFSSDANTERRAYPEQGWALRADMWGTSSASDYWNAVDINEWHTYSWLWRNNGGTDKDEVHLFINGKLVGSDYNGNLPNPVGNAADLDYVALAGGSTASYSYDDVWSFDSWDVSNDTGTFATLAWPDSVFIKYPLSNPFKGGPTQVTTSNVITYEFMVFDELNPSSICSLFVGGAPVGTVTATNLEHVEITDPTPRSNGTVTWQVRTNHGLDSPAWSYALNYTAPVGPNIVSAVQTYADSVLVTFDVDVDETTAEVIGNYGLAPADATITSARHMGSSGGGGSGTVVANAVASMNTGDTNTTNPTVTLATTAGDNFIVVSVHRANTEINNAGLVSITDTIGNTYNQLGTSGAGGEPMVFGAYNYSTNAGNVISVTGPNDKWMLVAMACSGVVGTSPVGATQTLPRFAQQNITTSGFSPTTEGSLVLFALTFSTDRTVSSVGTGQTILANEKHSAVNNYSGVVTGETITVVGANEQTVATAAWSYQAGVALEILPGTGGGVVPSNEVTLGLSGPLVIDTAYTLTINNVQDLLTDPIAANSTTGFTATLGTSENVAPTGNFSHAVNYLQVSFTDTSTDSDGTIASWAWQFGDGATSTLQNPVHTYSAEGSYQVTLTVTDDADDTDDVTQTVNVIATAPECVVLTTFGLPGIGMGAFPATEECGRAGVMGFPGRGLRR